ncbi:MAG: redoxin domain-containing protein [Lentisphaeria bacterium]|nr:redoxin domain-containing protein [Lentisphaeria bacterium]
MLFKKLVAVTFAAFAVLSSFAQESSLTCTLVSGEKDALPRYAIEDGRILIAYFSWSESGNTKYAAEQIRKAVNSGVVGGGKDGVIGGELLEIKPKNAYPKDYNACLAQAQKEIRDGVRVELANEPVDFRKYDVIFIGSPNWFGTIAPPAASFLASAELAGKIVIPFFTYGSGGMQNCERDTKSLLEKAGKVFPAENIHTVAQSQEAHKGIIVYPAKAIRGASVREADKEIAGWVGSMVTGYKKEEASGFYGFELKSWDGKEVKTSDFKGKVVLVVNTATRCGFTPQYERLEKLYKEYHDKGFELIDIPCNQFGGQAPGSDEEINTFCTSRYSTTFPRMTKCDVNGDKQIPLYKFLKEETNKADIRWNFTKFLIGRDGKVVKRFESGESLDELEKLIKSQLEQK